jgi:hypothetical protein
MHEISMGVVFTVAVGLGLVVGALAALSWKGRVAPKKERVPLYWPINNRRVANSEELKVWSWLIETFPDHRILIKIPITRFTIPQDEQKGPQLYKLLNALYCSFTVCSAAGKVVGCVDIPAASRIFKKNRQLKEGILFQRQIGYWVLTSSDLPEASAIRSKFLGEAASLLHGLRAGRAEKTAAGVGVTGHASDQPNGAVRVSRPASLPPDRPDRRDGQFNNDNSDFWSELNQQNSFLSQLDSRRAELASEREQ